MTHQRFVPILWPRPAHQDRPGERPLPFGGRERAGKGHIGLVAVETNRFGSVRKRRFRILGAFDFRGSVGARHDEREIRRPLGERPLDLGSILREHAFEGGLEGGDGERE